MEQQKKITQKLLVEGNDDKHVVLALCKKYTVVENFEIVDCGSIEKLFNQLDTRLKLTDTNTTIGIIVDADANLLLCSVALRSSVLTTEQRSNRVEC
ncbi:MAG: hypothetical protein QM541_11380 [Flavobacterium sp.]|nr:hypothetical protein [Flavobacterium sp.]